MDGNRRYARARQKPIYEGHREGFAALERTLDICRQLDVKCVSVYAFSMDNFHRPADEVDALMELLVKKMDEVCQERNTFQVNRVRLNVIGRKELLSLKVRQAIQRAEDSTRKNDSLTLNICMPYSSRDEITTAVESAINEALGTETGITEQNIEQHLATSIVDSPPVDILIRTSGVKRLSDYLLWQTNQNTQIYFSSVYWPNFSALYLLPAILNFQQKQWNNM